MNANKPSIVFCHGIWADGSSFGKVIPPLQADGYEVMAAQYGLDTPEGDVATVKRTLGRVSGPTILVGHSYGGSVITAAGTDDRVVGLVYIAALAPDANETSQSQQEPYPATDVFKYVELGEGRLWMKLEGVTCFAGDLSEEEQNSCGRPTMPRLPISSAGMRPVSPGSQSLAGTSWLTTTGRCSRNWNASWRSG